LFLLFII